jgi:hypothetical protein
MALQPNITHFVPSLVLLSQAVLQKSKFFFHGINIADYSLLPASLLSSKSHSRENKNT